MNVTASGYSQYYKSFTPLAASNLTLNFTLNSTTPSFLNLAIGGVARTGVLTGDVITKGYGQPISGANIIVRNVTDGLTCTATTNNAGGYQFDANNNCTLVSTHLYDVSGCALGRVCSPNYSVVV
jgi:hypothetical protein